MDRRRFLLTSLAGALAWPLGGAAQQAGKVPHVGVLGATSAEALPQAKGLRYGLRERGYVEGQSIVLEYRWARGRFERLPDLAAELVALKPAVIVAFVTQASLAAAKATSTIPIVMVAVGDPIGAGLVASLARPGGNVTGNSSVSVEVVGKSLEVLKEAAPGRRRVSILWNPANAIFQTQMVKRRRRQAALPPARLAHRSCGSFIDGSTPGPASGSSRSESSAWAIGCRWHTSPATRGGRPSSGIQCSRRSATAWRQRRGARCNGRRGRR
jgi:ABC transporter substrate binding protein